MASHFHPLEEETTPPEPEPSEAEAAAPKPLETEEPVETPAAQSPSPGEFRRGREFARGPTELPAPRAASRPLEKPKLVLEDPKASMPSRPGPVQLGSLEFSARTGDIAKGAAGSPIFRNGLHQQCTMLRKYQRKRRGKPNRRGVPL